MYCRLVTCSRVAYSFCTPAAMAAMLSLRSYRRSRVFAHKKKNAHTRARTMPLHTLHNLNQPPAATGIVFSMSRGALEGLCEKTRFLRPTSLTEGPLSHDSLRHRYNFGSPIGYAQNYLWVAVKRFPGSIPIHPQHLAKLISSLSSATPQCDHIHSFVVVPGLGHEDVEAVVVHHITGDWHG